MAVNSDFAGIYRVGEKASQPLPTSIIRKDGSIVTMEVWCKQRSCNFSAARELTAQRYPSRLWARLVCQGVAMNLQLRSILGKSFMKRAYKHHSIFSTGYKGSSNMHK